MKPVSGLARLREALERHKEHPFYVGEGGRYSYQDLLTAIGQWRSRCRDLGIVRGDVVCIQSDFHFQAIALLLALWDDQCIVPILSVNAKTPDKYYLRSGAKWVFSFDESAKPTIVQRTAPPPHAFISALREQERPGFIVFTSGSSGEPKAVLHDANRFVYTKKDSAKPLRTLAFLLFDHIAGLDTLLYTLFAGGTLVACPDRSPATVGALVEQHRVQVLPVSPSFLNLLCLSGVTGERALDSVEVVTYGSEPMNKATLARVNAIFPGARIEQKYGTSEFGSPRSRSRGRDELWIKLDAAETGIRIVDGILWIKHPAAMIGYLNADSPPLVDGFICTGDRVEQDDGWIRILGRDSDLINVGGEKVYPEEVTAALLQLDFVLDAVVYGEKNPLLGEVVAARLRVVDVGKAKSYTRAIRSHCLALMDRHKIPVKIEYADQAVKSERHKRIRA